MSKRRIALLVSILVVSAIIAALLLPINVDATVIKDTPIPTSLEPLVQMLPIFDNIELHLANLSFTWTQSNITFTVTITNASFWIWREESENKSYTLIYLVIDNFTLTTDPFVAEAHFKYLSLSIHLNVQNNEAYYSVHVTRKTNLLTLLIERLNGEFYVT